MKTIGFVITIMLIYCLISSGQTSYNNKVTGKITDMQGKPIEYAVVTIEDLGISTHSDSIGEYIFENIPPGSHQLSFKLTGFQNKTQSINISGKLNNYDIQLEESLIETPVIDVTGSFNATDINQSTFSVTSLNSEALTKQRNENLAETIANIPGVNNISTGSGIGKPVIRGLSSQSVLVIHDGVKQESQQWGDEHSPELSLYDIETIEILRGPASLIYGSDGIGGAINVISKPLQFSGKKNNIYYGELSLGDFTVNNEATGNLSLGYGTKNFGLKGHFGYRDAQNTETPDKNFIISTLTEPKIINGGELSNSGSKELQGGANAGFNGGFGNISFGFETFDRQLQIHPDPSVNPGATPNQKVNTNQFETQGNFKISNKFSLQPTVSYQTQLRKEYESTADKNLDNATLDLNLETFDLSTRLDNELNKYLSGSAGISFTRQVNRTMGPEKLIPNYNANTYGIYAMEKYSLSKLTFSAGARFDTKQLNVSQTLFDSSKTVHDQTLNFNAVTGSVGATYSPAKFINIYSNIGSGWRSPSEYELFADGVHEGANTYEKGLRTINPSVNPSSEKSINLDAGVRFNYKSVNLDVSVYRNTINNFIYPAPTGTNYYQTDPTSHDTVGIFPIYNISQGKSTFTGYEYNLQIQPMDWLLFSASGDYVKTRNDRTGFALPFTPPMKNLLEIKFQKNTLGKLYNAYVKFNSKIVSAQNEVDPLEAKTAGYVLFGGGLGFDFEFAHTISSIEVSIENMFNKAYVDHLSRFKTFALNPGRSVNLQLNVPFQF